MKKENREFAELLTDELRSSSVASDAAPMKAYMKDQFEFMGLRSPLRRKVFAEFIRMCGLPEYEDHFDITRQLYAMPWRECHYSAIDLSGKYKTSWDRKMFDHMTYLATNHSWWDTVDSTNSSVARKYFLKLPEQIKRISEWNKSSNMWLNRLSIIFQLTWKDHTDPGLLQRFILPHKDSKEFFIQKAIGWALRDYAKTDSEWVRDFVSRHALASLSRREALKHH
jgi:3-methyladenine DNA glycosylase AlkD